MDYAIIIVKILHKNERLFVNKCKINKSVWQSSKLRFFSIIVCAINIAINKVKSVDIKS